MIVCLLGARKIKSRSLITVTHATSVGGSKGQKLILTKPCREIDSHNFKPDKNTQF
jgi:hypothetical protein